MFSSDDEQDDDNGIFDQLKSIKPFTVDQLYLLHPDVGCPATDQQDESANLDATADHDNEIYAILIEYEHLRNRLAELKNDVKKLHKKTFEHVDKAWIFKDESVRKIGLCQSGKMAETTFKYKQAVINKKQLEIFSLGFSKLSEIISKEYIYYSFESQMKRNKIATQLSTSYQTQDNDQRKARLKSAISTLIDFLRHLGDSRSDFVIQCRKWLRSLAKRFLEEGTTDDYRFIISQIARGPVGTSDWTADLIECKPYDQVTGFDSVPQYITHCSALLSQLFHSLRSRVNPNNSNSSSSEENLNANVAQSTINNDQNWSLIDPRFNCSEELNITGNSSNILSEVDVIKLCLKMSVPQIFRTYVKNCLSSDEFCLETDKNYEFIMLKLLTIGTIIIKTYQIGLETFNSIQYGNLIEYLSSQTRCTVIILSNQWTEFKSRLRGVDDALLMRLQVEYDNFILRSILIILELRESGIWRHLSRLEPNAVQDDEGQHSWTTDSLRPAFNRLLQVAGLSTISESNEQQSSTLEPGGAPNSMGKPQSSARSSNSLTYEFSIEWFREVSEPMLWHILWQFYHNAFVSSCDYHSDNYWLEKFQENSVIYLFVNKIRDSPPGECSYLINSITSMLLSRTRQDSKIVYFIATEIFNLSFKHPELKAKVTSKGIASLIRCAERFPNLISVYIGLMIGENVDSDVVELMRECSLSGWLCNDDEMELLATWLIEFPLESPHNKVARLIISKILTNSPEARPSTSKNLNETRRSSSSPINKTPNPTARRDAKRSSGSRVECFVELKLRRTIALLLYEASRRHLPEVNEFGQQSLGASVEVAFGGLYCERNATHQCNLLDLATEVNYQQFYVWTWRLLFSLRLHILNQPETDWNDVQSPSGTSRSIKNTVLVNDSFHPTPSIQDSECLSLSRGLTDLNPMACYIYLMLTEATWQSDTLATCTTYLNVLVTTGHLTPSLMAMKFLTICHLNDLDNAMKQDKQIIEYFTSIITSNYDSTRLASLIACQLNKLKQFRQLQLSQFYINILLEVSSIVCKQISSSWFSSNELSLDKIACLLDYIVKFNFATQRLEIISKFYDCSYLIQDQAHQTSGWFVNTFTFTSNSSSNAVNSTKREFLTNLHALTSKFKKYLWLRWVTTECDSLRLEKIWEDIVLHLSGNESSTLDMAIKKVCPQMNGTILKSMLPIYSWIKLIFDMMEGGNINHPLSPLIWYNFYLNYFANSLNGVSVGNKLVQQETRVKLMFGLDSLFNYHLYKHRNWASTSGMQQNCLAQLYRAYKLWLQDSSLLEAYVDIDRLREDYSVPLLKAVMESSTEGACMQYIDLQTIETQNRNLIQVWTTATQLNDSLEHKMIFLSSSDNQANESMEILASVDDEASDAAISLMATANVKPASQQTVTFGASTSFLVDNNNSRSQRYAQDGEELARPLDKDLFIENDEYRTLDEMLSLVRRNFNLVFEESTTFGMNLTELDKTRAEIMELVQSLYSNKRREFVRSVSCSKGDECIGPARIKLEIEEAHLDERKSQCIQDRRRQCQELVGELLLMPRSRTVQSTIIIEENVKRLIADPGRARTVIESLLGWISEPDTYRQLNGSYYAANHLLKTVLELLSNNSDEVDAYNSALINVCLKHPGSVQIFSPHLSPSACSMDCFLKLYQLLTSQQAQLGSMAMFVLLSKFDLNNWLQNNQIKSNKEMHHMLIAATCLALKDMGKQPDESFELTFDLFKRHIQIELALPDRRKPDEIYLVLGKFLDIMRHQSLAPTLWSDFMTILGFERNHSHRRDRTGPGSVLSRSVSKIKRSTSSVIMDDQASILSELVPNNNGNNNNSDEVTIISLIEDVAKLAESQMIFDYHSLNSIMQMLSSFVSDHRHCCSPLLSSSPATCDDITLIEYYQDYLDQFSIVLLSITFMWLKAISEIYPNNHELIWKQFSELWYDWVYLNKNCQNVAKSSYNLMAGFYVASLKYMIHKLPDNSQLILQSTLATLTNYIGHTKQVVYLELTILQRCLKNLPWSIFLAGPEDFEHLASLSEQENYNISDLISHIISQMDTKSSISKIHQSAAAAGSQEEQLIVSHVAERLATILIIQSAHLKGYGIHVGRYLSLIGTDDITRLANLVLARMEFNVNLENSQNNKLLVNLLRFMCIKMDHFVDEMSPTSTSSSSSPQSPSSASQSNEHSALVNIDDSLDRSIIYARFVSSYLIDLIGRHPSVVKSNAKYLFAIMDNSLKDLKLLVSPELNLNQKTTLYESLLECCSCDCLDSSARLLLARALLESNVLRNRPIVVLEILHAIGHILRDGQVLVYMVEVLIDMYLNMNGHYEKVWKSFSLEVLPSDIYLNACIEQTSPLALLIYFESLYRGNSMGGAVRQLKDDDDDETNEAVSTTSSSRQYNQFNSTRIWSSFFHWLAQLTNAFNVLVSGNNNLTTTGGSGGDSLVAKMAAVWLRMLDMLEVNLQPFLRAAGDDPLQRINSINRMADNEQQQQQPMSSDQAKGDSTSLSSNKSQPTSQTKQSEPIKTQPPVATILASHKCLLDLIRQLMALFDSVNSGGLWSYLKSSSARNEQTSRISIISLSVASLLADRTVAYLNSMIPPTATNSNKNNADSPQQQQQQQQQQVAQSSSLAAQRLALLRDETGKLRKSCLAKLESSRKSKSFVECAQFLETLIESIQRNDKVHYREGLQLITTYVKSAYQTSASPSPKPASSSMNQIQSAPEQNSPTASSKDHSNYLNKILPSFGD